MGPRSTSLVVIALVVWQCHPAGQTRDGASASNTGYRVGLNYHATTSDFATGAFISRYNDPAVRSVVQGQLQSFADSGLSIIKTTLWQVGRARQSWQLSFPLSKRELSNLAAYARDVSATRLPDGTPLELHLTLAWLGCAEYTHGAFTSKVGSCGYRWPQFLDRARKSITDLTRRVGTIVGPDGRPAIARLYLDLEVMVGAKANQEQFLLDLYPFFRNAAAQAGIEGSIYFAIEPAEDDILDETYRDDAHPILDGRRSMYWLYRSVEFLRQHELSVPARLDFSFYPAVSSTSYLRVVTKVFDDFLALFPGHGAGVVETYYLENAEPRRALGAAFAETYRERGLPEEVIFWTTPGAEGDKGMAPPFDAGAFGIDAPAP